MRRLIALIALAFIVACGAEAKPADGELISSAPCARRPVSYDTYVADSVKQYQDEAAKAAKLGVIEPPVAGLPGALLTRTEYEDSVARPTACRSLLYRSDGLAVAAYVWEPANLPAGSKLPVIVALRGGNQDFSKYSADSRQGMRSFVSAGFIVVGVQYRGVDGGQGREEFGGADVHDVVNAVSLARSLPEADPRNVFLYGASRGGMMLFLALRDGAKVNAAADLSGITDLELEAKRRPAIEANVWRKLIPNYDADRARALARRSGVLVAQQVDLPPVLLLHGTADWRVDPRNTLEVAEALQARRRPYELHIFENDVHGLAWNWRERDRLVIDWFRRHMAH